jgi:pimeloyl-ACP methyl ester carboxylesterase
MKTYLTYGFLLALSAFVLTMALFLTGFQSSPEKLGAGQTIALVGVIAIAAAFLVLGTRARRAEWPPDQPFTYGDSFLSGFLIGLWAALFGMVGTYLYMQVINPNLPDLLIQGQADRLAAKGMAADQIEHFQQMTRWVFQPVALTVIGAVEAVIGNTIIAAISSAFIRRPAQDPAMPPAI